MERAFKTSNSKLKYYKLLENYKQVNMGKRFVSIWFPFLLTDWLGIRKPELKDVACVFTAAVKGRIIITACNALAAKQGIQIGMVLADARALVHELEAFDDKPNRNAKLLQGLAEWCIRYTPFVSIDLPDGILLDASGCTHLWDTEAHYLVQISKRLKELGYTNKPAIADTIGTSWAVSRFSTQEFVVAQKRQYYALLSLPPAALRLEQSILDRLNKLGLQKIERFIQMPRSVLRRRFGENLLHRIGQAMGDVPEVFNPIVVVPEYEERLPCLEPIKTAPAIEIAIKKLLEQLCSRLKKEGLGLRSAELKGFRIDGKIIRTSISTNQSNNDVQHLFKLFALNIDKLAPGLGVELFLLTANKVEPVIQAQDKLWITQSDLQSPALSALLDRVAGKVGIAAIRRFLPQAQYWPERAIKKTAALSENSNLPWHNPLGRPIHLLHQPENIQVSAPIPDYPPLIFIYKGKKHHIKKADGPERLERSWWLEDGEHRDYYIVEDDDGCRYWLFRAGHYSAENSRWFIHGFFA
ncbi:Y-family DNA polymerase [Pedobacter agri]|uniref:Y-family DNA polymerase n=1 Tax=Pedobacter agri TaxID=454586 RepID=UPI0027839776|nr:DNA polymerase Y family protein [Pedobacter agri]MDQ1142468.1 protein ImuB [Pedobacter agri]